MYAKMKKSLGNKRVLMTDEQIAEVVKVYAGNVKDATFKNEVAETAKEAAKRNGEAEAPRIVSKAFDTKYFGYRKVTVDRPPQPGKEIKVKFKKG